MSSTSGLSSKEEELITHGLTLQCFEVKIINMDTTKNGLDMKIFKISSAALDS